MPIQEIPVVSGAARRYGNAGIKGIKKHNREQLSDVRRIANNAQRSLKGLEDQLRGLIGCVGKLDPDHRKQFGELKRKIQNYSATYGAFFEAIL